MTSTNTTADILERGILHAARQQYEQPELQFSQELSWGERFDAFHKRNPGVYEAMVRLGREWVAGTGRPIGARALFERCRWEIAIATTDVEYKLNNNFAPYYARLIMQQEPDLAGLFKLRHSDEANMWAALRKHGIAA